MNIWAILTRISKLVVVVLIWCNCAQPAREKGAQMPIPKRELLKKSPVELYALAQSSSPEIQDSIYQTVIGTFQEIDKLLQIPPHLHYYKLLRGTNIETRPFILNIEGYLLQYAGKLDSAQLAFSESIKLSIELNQKVEETKALHGMGINLYYKGEYGQSTERLIEAMNAYSKLGDSTHLNVAKLDQCGNLYRMRDVAQMKKLAQSALPWFNKTRDTISIAATYNIFGLAYEQSPNWDSAIIWHEKALDIRRAYGDFRGAGESLNNIAVLYMDKKEFAKAISRYPEAIQLMEKAGDFRNVSVLKSNLGRCYQLMGDLENAEKLFKESASELLKNGQRDALAVVFERLSILKNKQGNFQDALKFYRSSRVLRDSLLDERKQQDIRELNIKFETALKEQQIARLEAQKRSNHLWLGLLLVSSALLVSSLFFYISRLRQKQKLLANEQKLLEAREQVQAKNLDMARLELNFHRKKLDETASNLSEKSRLVEELRENLDALRISLGDQLHGQEIQRSLSALYGMKILTDDDWNYFRIQFEQVHPGLINHFRKRFPELSDAELRLILLIKIGVRSREISTMLGISTESVNKTRYRLRKRLGLEESEKLEEFVEKFA